jgi:methylglutamate dehydrogenase subunit D
VVHKPHLFVASLVGTAAPVALGGATASPGVIVSELLGAGLATVTARKGRRAALLDAARSAFGADLPTTPRRAEGREIAFIWSGPDQWLACTHRTPAGEMEALLAAPFAGLASVVDQSHGRTLLRVTGPNVRDTLAKGVAVDLHPRAFKTGDAAASLVSHIPVHLWQIDDTPTYEFAVARSLAQSFWHWLAASAAQYGLEVVDR